jgi:hypothetical protein
MEVILFIKFTNKGASFVPLLSQPIFALQVLVFIGFMRKRASFVPPFCKNYF